MVHLGLQVYPGSLHTGQEQVASWIHAFGEVGEWQGNDQMVMQEEEREHLDNLVHMTYALIRTAFQGQGPSDLKNFY